MPRYGQDALTIAHDNVLSLAHHAETGLFECAHGVEVTDARDLGQGLDGYFNFANILAPKLLVDD